MNKKFVYEVGNNKKVILWCTANQISRCCMNITWNENQQRVRDLLSISKGCRIISNFNLLVKNKVKSYWRN